MSTLYYIQSHSLNSANGLESRTVATNLSLPVANQMRDFLAAQEVVPGTPPALYSIEPHRVRRSKSRPEAVDQPKKRR